MNAFDNQPNYNRILAKPGINKIGSRKYYCYRDTNNTIVVIPNWYRWTMASFVPIYFVLGFLSHYWWLR